MKDQYVGIKSNTKFPKTTKSLGTFLFPLPQMEAKR